MSAVERIGPNFDKIATDYFKGTYTGAQLKTKFT